MDYRLSVDRAHLVQGLRRLGKAARKQKRVRAIIGFDGSYLTVEVGNFAFLAQATGAWPGNAEVAPAVVFALAEVPPIEDPVIVTCDGEHLHFGPIKAECKWQPVSTALLMQPRQAEWHEALALKYTLPRGRIIAEGRGAEIRVAERKLAATVRRVAKALAPMGVTVADVELLVDRRLAERYGVEPKT